MHASSGPGPSAASSARSLCACVLCRVFECGSAVVVVVSVLAVPGRDRCARKRSRRCMWDAGLDRVCGDRTATCATAAGAIGAPAVVPDCVLVCRTVPRVSRAEGGAASCRPVARARACHGDVVRVCKRIHTPSIHPRHPFGPIRSSVRTRVLSEVHVAVRGHGDLFIRCIVGWDIVIYINTSIYILNTAKA